MTAPHGFHQIIIHRNNRATGHPTMGVALSARAPYQNFADVADFARGFQPRTARHCFRKHGGFGGRGTRRITKTLRVSFPPIPPCLAPQAGSLGSFRRMPMRRGWKPHLPKAGESRSRATVAGKMPASPGRATAPCAIYTFLPIKSLLSSFTFPCAARAAGYTASFPRSVSGGIGLLGV